MADPTYIFERVGTSPDELARVSGLFHAVWPRAAHLDTAYLRWLYADNPAGSVVGFNAVAEGALAAHYVVVPLRASLCGAEVRAVLSLNTATHPGHQGKGLFTRLAALAYEAAAAEGFDHVVGVANANSTPGFLRKLGFQKVAPLEARLAICGPQTKERPGAGPSWRRLWSPVDLAWRLARPHGRYSWRAWGAGALCLAHTGEWGIQAILRAEPAGEGAETAKAALPHRRTWSPLLWMGLSRRLRFGRARGFILPERFRRSPLNLIYRPLREGSPPLEADGVEFEAADFDAY